MLKSNQNNSQLFPRNNSSRMILILIVGIILGVIIIFFSPMIALLAIGAIAGVVLIYYRPEFAILGILFSTAGFIFESDFPLIPIGIGSLHIPDILMLLSLAIIMIKALVDRSFKLFITPLSLWVLVFLGLLLFSTVIGAAYDRTSLTLGIREYRVHSYYLLLFCITNLVQKKKQLHTLFEGIIWLATAVSIAMILQFSLGVTLPFLPERVETLQTGETVFDNIARIIPPGQSTIVVALILLICILVINSSTKNKWLYLAQTALIGFAVIITFTRSFWVQVGLAVIILALIAKKHEKKILFQYGLAVFGFLLLFIAVSFAFPNTKYSNLANATIDRVLTLFKPDTLEEHSLEWRYIENSYVIEKFSEHPIIGLGLGAKYRSIDERIDYEMEYWDARYYIHNAHFWILLKGGALSYACLLIISGLFLYRGFKYGIKIEDNEKRAWVISNTLIYVGILIGAILNPMFNQWYWTPFIGILFGTNELIIQTQFNTSQNKEPNVTE